MPYISTGYFMTDAKGHCQPRMHWPGGLRSIPAVNLHVRSALFTRQAAALRLGRVLLMIGGLWCCTLSLFSQTSDAPSTDQPNRSWTATTDLKSDNLLSTHIPVRMVESHSQNGNRTLDERSVQIQGTDGYLKPYQEIEKETLQVDATTVRTTIRTFGRDVNGAKSLIQVSEEEKHTLPGGDLSVLRITLNPDVNGKLQPVQRDLVETKKDKNIEETNVTVMLPNINGGFAPAFKTHELSKRRVDGTTESQKTTLVPDGAGKWEVSETQQVTTTQEGANRTAEERVIRRDFEGKLGDVSRVVSEESNGNSEEKRTIVETYSIDVPGTARDGHLHLVERAVTERHTSTSGEQVTEKKVEQPGPGDPLSPLRISVLVNDKTVPGPSGKLSTVTIGARDLNGRMRIVSVDTRKSDRIPTIQIQQVPSEQPK